MSDLFMDMHRRRQRWHNQPNTPPTTSTSKTTTTTTAATITPPSSESPSSTQQNINDQHIFSHRNNYSSTKNADAAFNANYNFDDHHNHNEKGKHIEHINDHADDNNSDDDDEFANILSLKLRKPKHWKWELSTSKSCSNIALPRILLYDHKGKLLVDAQGDSEAVYKQDDYSEKPKRDKSKKRSHNSRQQQTQYQQRSATTNLTHSIRKALEQEFNGLQIQEATPSPEPYSSTSQRSHRSRKAIDFNTTDLPDYGLSRRSSSLRGVRFNVEDDDDQDYFTSHIPEFLPTPPSTTTPTTTSSSSGPREKRKYRRSQSSGRSSAHSESILERFSFQKGRFSSPECEYAEEKQIHHGPRYFLRTSKAGTLLVQEDSFSQHPRRRRRPIKNRSTESLQSSQKSPNSGTSPARQEQQLQLQQVELQRSAGNSPVRSEMNRSGSRRQQTIRRNLTEGNILLNKQLSTSEEDVANVVAGQKQQLMDNINSRHLRKYVESRNKEKALNYTADVHQNGKVR